MTKILGINSFHAGASAALIIDGKVEFAIAEERLNRVKYFSGFPSLSIQECLKYSNLKINDIDHIAVGRNPTSNLDKKIFYTFKNLHLLPNLLKIKASKNTLDDLKTLLEKECDFKFKDMRFETHKIEHHIAHTASAFYNSGFASAAGITIDGSGDFVTCMMTICKDKSIIPIHKIYVPNSLGTFYSAICQYIGFENYGDEGKVMGLAPLGKDTYRDLFLNMINYEGGNLILNKNYFTKFGNNQGIYIREDGTMGVSKLYSDKLTTDYGPARKKNTEIGQKEKDFAFSLQKRFEEIYIDLLNDLYDRTQNKNLVLAGGCALNSVANGKIYDFTKFKKTFIHPAAGDDGLAVGAALYVAQKYEVQKQSINSSPYLGKKYSKKNIQSSLAKNSVGFLYLEETKLINRVVDDMCNGKVIGWFQGRSEWGPRALGNRSIISHPGFPNMKDILNARIKKREPFRPFAPIVLEEYTDIIFERSESSPYMLHVYKIKKEWRSKLSAVNHIDGTGRLQTLKEIDNPRLYKLIKTFYERTTIPVILNTSFNENEPIVETPEEAIKCFLRTKMDTLAIDNFYCNKTIR